MEINFLKALHFSFAARRFESAALVTEAKAKIPPPKFVNSFVFAGAEVLLSENYREGPRFPVPLSWTAMPAHFPV